jgi:hypothetical protein
LLTYFKASNTRWIDEFGITVAVSAGDSTLAEGALGEASAATGTGGNLRTTPRRSPGAVYVFTRWGMTRSPTSYIKDLLPFPAVLVSVLAASRTPGSRAGVFARVPVHEQ